QPGGSCCPAEPRGLRRDSQRSGAGGAGTVQNGILRPPLNTEPAIRRYRRMRATVAWAILLVLPAFLSADDADPERLNHWPQWRGPLNNGVAPRGDPPVEWSESKNVRWKVEITGSGSATPVVWGEKLFVLTAVDTGKKPAGAPDLPPAPPPPNSQGMSTSAPATLHRF